MKGATAIREYYLTEKEHMVYIDAYVGSSCQSTVDACQDLIFPPENMPKAITLTPPASMLPMKHPSTIHSPVKHRTHT